MAIRYEINTEISLPNITVENIIFNENHTGYRLKSNAGYVLHDKRIDDTDENGNTTMNYKIGATTVSATYDFSNTTVIDGYTAYGVNQFFARPIIEVPENQIFGTTPDTETI